MIAAILATPLRHVMSTYSKITAGYPLPARFEQKVPVSLERGRFTVKTIETAQELNETLRLRYSVFQREFRKKKIPFGFDVDNFDSFCDHLVIKDKEIGGRIIGTYRLITADSCPGFYSEQEFVLDEFLEAPGAKLELGRACIHPDYRNGVVINLLWRGIVQYMRQMGAQYLFGCASIKTMQPDLTAAVYTKLAMDGHLIEGQGIEPTEPYRFHAMREILKQRSFSAEELAAADAAVPPLFKAYLKAGVKVFGEPALDRDFSCIDFLTVLKMDQVEEKYEKRYLRC